MMYVRINNAFLGKIGQCYSRMFLNYLYKDVQYGLAFSIKIEICENVFFTLHSLTENSEPDMVTSNMRVNRKIQGQSYRLSNQNIFPESDVKNINLCTNTFFMCEVAVHLIKWYPSLQTTCFVITKHGYDQNMTSR